MCSWIYYIRLEHKPMVCNGHLNICMVETYLRNLIYIMYLTFKKNGLGIYTLYILLIDQKKISLLKYTIARQNKTTLSIGFKLIDLHAQD